MKRKCMQLIINVLHEARRWSCQLAIRIRIMIWNVKIFTYVRVYGEHLIELLYSQQKQLATCVLLPRTSEINQNAKLFANSFSRPRPFNGCVFGRVPKAVLVPRSRSYSVVPLPWRHWVGVHVADMQSRTILGCRCMQQIFYGTTKSDRLAECRVPEIVYRPRFL
jgi:hypothetical protein